MILAIQKELVNVKEDVILIPSRFHNSIIGAKGKLIRSIMEDCGGVTISFPPEGSNSGITAPSVVFCAYGPEINWQEW